MKKQSELCFEIIKRYRADSLKDSQLAELEEKAESAMYACCIKDYSGRSLVDAADYPAPKRQRLVLYLRSLGYEAGYFDAEESVIYIYMFRG